MEIRKELNEKILFLKDLVNTMFSSIFRFRYRDTLPALRTLCLQVLGKWVIMDPKTYLQEDYTKCFGWMLNDKVFSKFFHSFTPLPHLFLSPCPIPPSL